MPHVLKPIKWVAMYGLSLTELPENSILRWKKSSKFFRIRVFVQVFFRIGGYNAPRRKRQVLTLGDGLLPWTKLDLRMGPAVSSGKENRKSRVIR